jgi:hypothetical protein
MLVMRRAYARMAATEAADSTSPDYINGFDTIPAKRALPQSTPLIIRPYP